MENNQKNLLYQCRTDIIKKYVGNQGYRLKHTDYQQLADEIFEETKISLSLSTLKRFFSKEHDSLPKISTLNALASYLGFDNWKEYCRQNSADTDDCKGPQADSKKMVKGLLFIPAGIVCLLAIYFVLTKTGNKPEIDISRLRFSVHDFDSTRMPVTVTFAYDLEGSAFDSANLHPLGLMGKGQDDVTYLDPNDSTVTYTYLYPGCFYPKLVIDGEIFAQERINLTTKTWLAAAGQYSPFYIKYFSDKEIFENGKMAFSTEVFSKANFPVSDVEQTSYHLFQNFDFSEHDNFCFESGVRNSLLERSAGSGTIQIDLLFETAAIQLNFDDEKSSFRELGLWIIDAYYSSQKQDLSFLNRDFGEWNTIKCKTLANNFELHVNDSLVFQTKYTQSPGKLIGIRYVFNGLGEVDYVRFFNSQDELVYADEFD